MLGRHSPLHNAALATKARPAVKAKVYKREPKQALIDRCLNCTESADKCNRCGNYKKYKESKK